MQVNFFEKPKPLLFTHILNFQGSKSSPPLLKKHKRLSKKKLLLNRGQGISLTDHANSEKGCVDNDRQEKVVNCTL